MRHGIWRGLETRPSARAEFRERLRVTKRLHYHLLCGLKACAVCEAIDRNQRSIGVGSTSVSHGKVQVR